MYLLCGLPSPAICYRNKILNLNLELRMSIPILSVTIRCQNVSPKRFSLSLWPQQYSLSCLNSFLSFGLLLNGFTSPPYLNFSVLTSQIKIRYYSLFKREKERLSNKAHRVIPDLAPSTFHFPILQLSLTRQLKQPLLVSQLFTVSPPSYLFFLAGYRHT